jgi:hypothetical protein
VRRDRRALAERLMVYALFALMLASTIKAARWP